MMMLPSCLQLFFKFRCLSSEGSLNDQCALARRDFFNMMIASIKDRA